MARTRGYGMRIRWYEDTLTPRVRDFPDELDNFVGSIIDYFVPRTESYARTNAPWTDRTGNARNGLRATADHALGDHAVEIAHSVPYGIWLEVRHEGRYAIIEPTVQNIGREMMETFRSAMGRI